MRWDEMRGGEMRWDEMNEVRWDEMRWGEVRWGGMRCGEMGWSGMKWDEVRWDETRWEADENPWRGRAQGPSLFRSCRLDIFVVSVATCSGTNCSTSSHVRFPQFVWTWTPNCSLLWYLANTESMSHYWRIHRRLALAGMIMSSCSGLDIGPVNGLRCDVTGCLRSGLCPCCCNLLASCAAGSADWRRKDEKGCCRTGTKWPWKHRCNASNPAMRATRVTRGVVKETVLT